MGRIWLNTHNHCRKNCGKKLAAKFQITGDYWAERLKEKFWGTFLKYGGKMYKNKAYLKNCAMQEISKYKHKLSLKHRAIAPEIDHVPIADYLIMEIQL